MLDDLFCFVILWMTAELEACINYYQPNFPLSIWHESEANIRKMHIMPVCYRNFLTYLCLRNPRALFWTLDVWTIIWTFKLTEYLCLILQGLGLVQAAATKCWPQKAENHPKISFHKKNVLSFYIFQLVMSKYEGPRRRKKSMKTMASFASTVWHTVRTWMCQGYDTDVWFLFLFK